MNLENFGLVFQIFFTTPLSLKSKLSPCISWFVEFSIFQHTIWSSWRKQTKPLLNGHILIIWPHFGVQTLNGFKDDEIKNGRTDRSANAWINKQMIFYLHPLSTYTHTHTHTPHSCKEKCAYEVKNASFNLIRKPTYMCIFHSFTPLINTGLISHPNKALFAIVNNKHCMRMKNIQM